MRYLRRISRTKIQISQIPPVISVRTASSRKLPKPYFFVFAIGAAYGPPGLTESRKSGDERLLRRSNSAEEATDHTRQLITIR